MAVPATAGGSLAVTMDGHPEVEINGVSTRIAVTNAVAYAAITDEAAQPRRNAVAIEKCDDCHSQLAMHGNNRTDEPAVCVTCHNPNATDDRQRGAGDCDAVLGPDDVTIDMKVMIHAIHAGGATGETYEVCGYQNSVHSYDFVYPGRLDNCEGCHNEGTYFPVDPAAVLGTTVDVGADPTPIDDDVAVLEVGLGGRLDAVNIIEPDVAVVTAIGLDQLRQRSHERAPVFGVHQDVGAHAHEGG